MKVSNTCPITLKSIFFKLEKSSNIFPLLVSSVSKIYLSFISLELSLKELTKLKSSFNIAMLHYPPFNRDGKLNEFATLMKEYNINCCIYGHLHGQGHKYIREGFIDGVEFHCVSGDYLSFRPKLIFKEV